MSYSTDQVFVIERYWKRTVSLIPKILQHDILKIRSMSLHACTIINGLSQDVNPGYGLD